MTEQAEQAAHILACRPGERGLAPEWGLPDPVGQDLDEERRRRLGGMGRAKRWLTLLWWLLEGLILKLPPLRRLMLLLCLLMFFWGAFSLSS